MEVQELRIGNIVSDFGGREAGVSAITERGTIKLSSEHYTDESFNLNERVITPIPLTPEILEKCGFEKVDHIHGYSFWSIIRKRKQYNVPVISIYENKTEINGYIINHITYLHQLQNLYFALTGKELTYTP